MPLVNPRVLVVEVDANAVAIWLEGVVSRVEVATINIDGDGVFDAIGIKGASDGAYSFCCVVITEMGDIF